MPRRLFPFFLYNFLAYGLAAAPFEFFFFTERGISFQEFSWLCAIYYGAMVALDVPAGVLADRFGRKFCLVAGPLGFALGFGLCLAADSFALFALAQAVTGAAHAFLSGATSSFLYDDLKQNGEEVHFLRLEALATVFRLTGTSLAFFLGGWTASRGGLEASFWVSIALTSAAGLTALFLREPRVHELQHPSAREIFAGSIASLARDRGLRWITVYFALLFIWLRLSFHTYQPKLREIGLDDYFAVGLVYSGLNVAAALASRYAPSLQAKLGEGALFAGMQACLVLSFLALGLTSAKLAFLLFFVQQIPFGVHFPVVSNFVNQRIPSSQRTTVLSFQSMAGRLSYALFFPVFGWWASQTSLREAFLVSAALGAIGMAWLAVRRPRAAEIARN